ncbi:hypothetical protein M404DRAFT_1000479 [Pisolithus tinctorius Marx 270]|uniref:Uncharacterized protein n=1 Tax=Pisolithus tinctorius Marx 270 TaxID=870435 RepID=A0A0C3K4W6_PISTI|nr:hypothetical protein M404DRAFT_1000479 [Pisolithus tinctorius Marx 270]
MNAIPAVALSPAVSMSATALFHPLPTGEHCKILYDDLRNLTPESVPHRGRSHQRERPLFPRHVHSHHPT